MEKYIEDAETFIKIDKYHLWITSDGEYIEAYDGEALNDTSFSNKHASPLVQNFMKSENQ